jgi:murein DD-endopeptidase MepM/ murein hydrolase activator NlpD
LAPSRPRESLRATPTGTSFTGGNRGFSALLRLVCTATVVTGLSVGAGASLGADGGGGVTTGSGGVGMPTPPKVNDVRCIRMCAGLRVGAVGSKVRLTGRSLGEATEVRFTAETGKRIRVTPYRVEDESVRARVPDGATSGKPRVVDDLGGSAISSQELRIVATELIPPDPQFRMAAAEVHPDPTFFYGKRDPTLTYAFEGSATDVRIEVVNKRTRRVVSSWVERDRKAFIDNRAVWNGARERAGEAPNGNYRFRVGATTDGDPTGVEGSGFHYYDHMFPVRARHEYWDGWGAGRGHEGQDVGARCGAKIVAARGGRVSWKRYHSAAGYYVVIDGKRDRHDYMYAHLLGPASVHEGERVRTGERIGRVGATGNATGCHLHFEYWTAPWWDRGRPLPSVTRVLKRWDGWS